MTMRPPKRRAWLAAHRGIVRITAAAAACAVIASAAFGFPSVYPTGVTRYDPAKAYNSFVLFSGGIDHKTHLIDMNGNEVHSWHHEGIPAVMLDPKSVGGKRGLVGLQLEALKPGEPGATPGLPIFNNKTFGIVDWDDKVVWQWGDKAPGGYARQHHDWRRLPNGHMMILTDRPTRLEGFGDRNMLDDVVFEVDRSGNVVWQWRASEHLDEFGFTLEELDLLHKTKNPDFLHINDMAVLGRNRWAATDKRFAPENIIVCSREANFTVIVSRKTGKVVWRIGPDYPIPDNVKPADRAKLIDQISGQHDAHMIPKGLPGAGNIMIFDNQGEAGYPPAPVRSASRVLEIDPVKKEIVWQYTAVKSGLPGTSFFSTNISSARRLPNGNTLIDEGMNGRIFQVTSDGEIVWEYVSRFSSTQPGPPGSPPSKSIWVYRAEPVPYDWVPRGTPHTENPVTAPDLAAFDVSASSN
ncbi:MAG: aryl-sulfate sulfotransferase [Alphaproteobacteria bacterium]